MAKVTAQDVPSFEEDEVQKVLKQANEIIMKRLSSKLDANPTFDLSELLRQQAYSYPQLRHAPAQAPR